MGEPVIDRELGVLNVCIYYSKDPKELDSSFQLYDKRFVKESGFGGQLYIKQKGDGQSTAAFVFLGTDSSKGSEIYQAQMRADKQLAEDTEEEVTIIGDAINFVEEASRRLEQEHGGARWRYFTTGHSLGGSVASAVTIHCDEKIERCVTFENPGVFKRWREKAEEQGCDHWKEKITEYVTFPNPINSTQPKIGRIIRVQLSIHSKTSGGHIARCLLGSSLRLMVWVSIANIGAVAFAGQQGFWAAKVGSVAVKLAKLTLGLKLTPKRIKGAFREGISDDQAGKDARMAVEEGQVDNPSAKPMVPLLRLLPPNVRPAFIVGFWAAGTAACCDLGYNVMRSAAQLKDTAQEHNIEAMLKEFKPETGKPKKAIEMKSWPTHKVMLEHDMVGEHFRRSFLEALTPFHPTAYGMHNVLSREKVLHRRASTIPLFDELRQLECAA